MYLNSQNNLQVEQKNYLQVKNSIEFELFDLDIFLCVLLEKDCLSKAIWLHDNIAKQQNILKVLRMLKSKD